MVEWQYKEPIHKRWHPYGPEVSAEIEVAYKDKKAEPVFSLTKGNFKGDQILFGGPFAERVGGPLVHRNANTGEVREMRRLEVEYLVEVDEDDPDPVIQKAKRSNSGAWATLPKAVAEQLHEARLQGRQSLSVSNKTIRRSVGSAAEAKLPPLAEDQEDVEETPVHDLQKDAKFGAYDMKRSEVVTDSTAMQAKPAKGK